MLKSIFQNVFKGGKRMEELIKLVPNLKKKERNQRGDDGKGQKMQKGNKWSLAPNDQSAQLFSFFSDLKTPCRPVQAQK